MNVGWNVTLSPVKGKPGRARARAGTARAVHTRTGAVETIAYTAQAGSAGALVAKVGDERLRMADLDAETRAALVVAELPSLLRDVNDARVLALVVEAARELPPDGETPEGVARRAALTRVLLAAIEGTPSAANLRLASELGRHHRASRLRAGPARARGARVDAGVARPAQRADARARRKSGSRPREGADSPPRDLKSSDILSGLC